MTKILNPATLIALITSIEKRYPGWRYSVSQSDGLVYLDHAPTRASPSIEYRYAATTKEGQRGHLHYASITDNFDVEAFLNSVHARYGSVLLAADVIGVVGKAVGFIRRQKPDDIARLSNVYTEFVQQYQRWEIAKSVIIDEVYIGSSSESVDVSLKGRCCKNNTTFDYAHDLSGTDVISDAFNNCINDLLQRK